MTDQLFTLALKYPNYLITSDYMITHLLKLKDQRLSNEKQYVGI